MAWWPRARYHLRGGLIALALCTLPYIPLAIWQIPTFVTGRDTGHTFYMLDEIIYALFYNWSAGLSDQWVAGLPDYAAWIPILLYAGVGAVALVGLIDAEPAKDGLHPMRSALAVVVWLMLPIVLIYGISTRAPVFEPRYLLWVAPAFYILAALGVVWIAQRNRLLACLAGVALSSVSLLGLYSQVTIPIRPDLRGAASYLAPQMQANDRFVFQIPYTRYAFEYYLPRYAPQWPVESAPNPADGLGTIQDLRQRIADAPYTNAGAMPDDVSANLYPLLEDLRRTWYVEAEADMWDSRAMVRAWFDQHMRLVSRREFRGVTVSLYEKP